MDGSTSNEGRGLPVVYMLEIYERQDPEATLANFETASPFMAISKGDLISPSTWPGSQAPMKTLRVLSVEHIIWSNKERIAHKVCVYTEQVEASLGLYLG